MRALVELILLSLRGRVVRRVKRLKDPRQILAMVAGLAYAAWFILRPFLLGVGHMPRHMPVGMTASFGDSPYAPAIQIVMALGFAVVAIITWIGTSSRPSFRLTEAEIHLLMPAPLSRRQILQFALLKQQAGILMGAVVLGVLTALRGAASPAAALLRLAASWAFLTLLDLHIKGIALWKARLLELPAGAARRRRAAAMVLVAAWCAAVLAGLWIVWHAAVFAGSIRTWRAGEFQTAILGVAAAVRGGLAGRLLLPFLWIAAPVAAATRGARLFGWLFVAALLAVHYEWVVRSSASFEEAALERARRQVARGSRRNRRYETLKRTARERAPFRLEGAWAPELAITWKNLILRGRMPLVRLVRLTLLGLAALAVVLAVTVALGLPTVVVGVLVGLGLVFIAIIPLIAGNVFRNDLHADFLHLEILRAWPVSGWRLIVAEILAPMTALVWLELTAAGVVGVAAAVSALGARLGLGATDDLRVVVGKLPVATGGAALVTVLASLVLLSLVVGLFTIALQNLGILLLPGWVPLGYASQRGTSMFGQNLVVGLGRLIGLALGAIPPFVVAGLLFVLLNVLLHLHFAVWEVPLLAVAAALPFLAETYLMVRFSGAIWDRLDPSQELLDPVS